MAYAGQARPRSGSGTDSSGTTRASRAPRPAPAPIEDEDTITEATGQPFTRNIEWGDAGLFGAGIALGVMIGAGAALLFAPQSGLETRDSIAKGTRDFGYRATDVWEDLRDELRQAANRSTKRLRRGVRRGRTLGEDVVSTVRRRS